MIKIRVLAGLAMLAACSVANAGAAKNNAALYAEQLKQQETLAKLDGERRAAESQAQAIVDAEKVKVCAQAPDPTSCLMLLEMGQMVRAMAAGRDSAPAQAPAPPYQRSMSQAFRDVMTPFVPMMSQAMSTYQGVEALQSNERIALSRDATFAGLANSALTANAAVAGAAVENAQPVYNVGGDWTGGDRVTTTIGDNFTGGDRSETNISAGHDIVGGDQRIGDNVGRDQIGGDRTDNSGVIGDYNEYRFESPGPISNDGNCDGSGDSDCSDNSGGAP